MPFGPATCQTGLWRANVARVLLLERPSIARGGCTNARYCGAAASSRFAPATFAKTHSADS
jgi:hypothetical protein